MVNENFIMTAISEGLALYDADLRGNGQELRNAPELAAILAEANDIWPLAVNSSGVTLYWNTDDEPVPIGEVLTSDAITKLAEVISFLAGREILVTLGKSARGYTYLNVQLDNWISAS
jgi:hypothetical protein